MLRIRPYTHNDVYNIELDYEFDAASRAGLLGHNEIVAYTLLDDDKVLAVGGAHIMWFGAGEGWVLVSPDCLRTPASFARYAKRLFGSILQDTDLRRVQASIHVDGFENEGIMRKYGVDGGDYYRMARVQ
jgi:hypothetical protein